MRFLLALAIIVNGLFWLLCALALTVAGDFFLFRQASWWWVALPALVLSQVLIFVFWGDARFGTIANLIILIPVIAAAMESRPDSYGNRYQTAVREGLSRYADVPLVTEACLNAASPVRSSTAPAPVARRQRDDADQGGVLAAGGKCQGPRDEPG